MAIRHKSKVSSTIISGDHEFTGVEIEQPLSVDGFVGGSLNAKAYFLSKVCGQLSEMLANENITDMATFFTYTSSDGQVGFQAIDMGAGENGTKSRVTVTSAAYNLELEQARTLYYNLYGQIDVMFNSEDQERSSNQFCFGDINNNFWLGK
jgi:hypothetical protein